VYNNKIVAERSYMQASNTRVVTFEMCGNDGLQARASFKSQTGTCNYSGLKAAPNNTTGSANAVTVSGIVMNGTMGSSSDNDYLAVPGPALR